MEPQTKRLYRSRTNRMVGGVCAGIADYLNLDPTIIRLLFLLLIFVSGGAGLILYLAMLVIVPELPVGGVPPASPVPPASSTQDDNIPPAA